MVELKKELPEILRNLQNRERIPFSRSRRLKEKRYLLSVYFVPIFQERFQNAMGCAVVGLCSVSDETIPDAEKRSAKKPMSIDQNQVMDLPKQINVHSSIFSDLVVGETTCDGKKKMYTK